MDIEETSSKSLKVMFTGSIKNSTQNISLHRIKQMKGPFRRKNGKTSSSRN